MDFQHQVDGDGRQCAASTGATMSAPAAHDRTSGLVLDSVSALDEYGDTAVANEDAGASARPGQLAAWC